VVGDSTAGEEYVTVVNKTYGDRAADAAVTISMPGAGPSSAEMLTLASGRPGDVTSATATLGGAPITGDVPWGGTWRPLATGARPDVTLTVPAASAAVVRIRAGS
jgi:hypothetical protein